jgi:hypothetical protein
MTLPCLKHKCVRCVVMREYLNCKTITCPEPNCKSVMEHNQVQRWAIAPVFKTYDQLLRDCLQRDEEFRWFARPACGAGQKHPAKDRSPIITCYKCKSKTCFTHPQVRTGH